MLITYLNSERLKIMVIYSKPVTMRKRMIQPDVVLRQFNFLRIDDFLHF